MNLRTAWFFCALLWLGGGLQLGLWAEAGPEAETPAFPNFAGTPLEVREVRHAESLGMINAQTSLLLSRRDGAVLGLWSPGGGNLAAATPRVSLWSLEAAVKTNAKPLTLTADMAKKVTVEPRGDSRERTLRVTYALEQGQVVVEATLSADSPKVHWRCQVKLSSEEYSLWSLSFPQIPLAAADPEPPANEMLTPYRRGQVRLFGKAGPRGETELPYPGPSAKFQFMAVYGRMSGRGVYFQAADGEGYTKSFVQNNDPAANRVIFAARHYPAGRGAAGGVREFAIPYEMVTQTFMGDWWDAARIYREWWQKQVWASKGLLAERKDLPDWLVKAPLAVRASTTKAARTVPNNKAGLLNLSHGLEQRPFFGVWYGYPQAPEGAKALDEGGLGHVLPPKPGLVDTLREVKKQGIHLEGYIQSVIYDASLPSQDDGAVGHAVTLDGQGRRAPYGAGEAPHLLAMCRFTDWWQNRLVDLSKQAVGEFGFAGVYLDSFGKGAPECFAKDHGHPIGGGNTVIAGQRRLAQRVREAIKAIDPQAIMSGEDPIEAFRDLLDVNLYSVNVMSNYVPIYRTVWGDYSLGHGRVLGPGKSGGSLAPELAVLFLEGTIPGRLYTDSPEPFLLQAAYARDWEFFQKLDHYTQAGLAWLRLGEYLHPLYVSPAPPPVEFIESVENKKILAPAILNSVTRSHTDGSVAIVLVNISEQPQKFTVPIDSGMLELPPQALPGGRVQLYRMNEAGAQTLISGGVEPWAESVALAPRDVAFLILRPGS